MIGQHNSRHFLNQSETKLKINHDLLARVFPRLPPVARIFFVFSRAFHRLPVFSLRFPALGTGCLYFLRVFPRLAPVACIFFVFSRAWLRLPVFSLRFPALSTGCLYFLFVFRTWHRLPVFSLRFPALGTGCLYFHRVLIRSLFCSFYVCCDC